MLFPMNECDLHCGKGRKACKNAREEGENEISSQWWRSPVWFGNSSIYCAEADTRYLVELAVGTVSSIDMGLLMFSSYIGADVCFGCSRDCEKEVRLHAWNNV